MISAIASSMLDAAVRQEREDCAVICDAESNFELQKLVSQYDAGCFNTAEYLADEIRNQGEAK